MPNFIVGCTWQHLVLGGTSPTIERIQLLKTKQVDVALMLVGSRFPC